MRKGRRTEERRKRNGEGRRHRKKRYRGEE